MLYSCACGYSTTEWHERKEHLQKCGKPVNEEFVPEIQELPQRKMDGSLKDFLS